MDERAALSVIGDIVDAAGDDAAVVGETVLTIDMLHAETDFPEGTTARTMGWRAVGASLSDVAAMGATATATVAVYGAPAFEREALGDFVAGASDVSTAVGAEYVGGDLDGHREVTVATTAIGTTEAPVRRSGAAPGDVVCVTGALGRTAAALRAFERGDVDRGNDLFRFTPRVEAGRALASHASAMMDSSDGLARSAHQLAEASGVGVALRGDGVPIHDALREAGDERPLHEAMTVGEDFELVCTVPPDAVAAARRDLDVALTAVGTVTEESAGVVLDGAPLPDEGWTHGDAIS
ncbi:MAG: thiamine-phosphate kinase [Halanaeroarchaeum sp.]